MMRLMSRSVFSVLVGLHVVSGTVLITMNTGCLYVNSNPKDALTNSKKKDATTNGDPEAPRKRFKSLKSRRHIMIRWRLNRKAYK